MTTRGSQFEEIFKSKIPYTLDLGQILKKQLPKNLSSTGSLNPYPLSTFIEKNVQKPQILQVQGVS